MAKAANILLTSLLFVVLACSSNSPKTIAQQNAGNKVIMITSYESVISKGSGSFYIEFHSAADNSFIDVGRIDASAKMQMPENPMAGEITVARTEIPGRYKATYNFSMSGKWLLVVHYTGTGETQFELNVN